MTIAWPVTGAALLSWAQLLVAWVFSLYYMPPTWSTWSRLKLPSHTNWLGHAIPKIVMLIVVPVIVLGRLPARALLIALTGVLLALVLSWARERGADAWKTRGAELELGTTAAYVGLSAVLLGNVAVRPLVAPVSLPLSDGRVAALVLCAAITLFVIRGGTQVVRATLTKAGSLPRAQQQQQVDEAEYNRGRLIGVIERLLLSWLVAGGSYAAMGFIIAAKGLIRSKDLESRDFAEYFLVGTLASTAVALVAGGLLRLVLLQLW
ncbi:MAG: hypothetical protein WD801_03630 [Gemmatimonadaceae bacterium]